MWRRKPHPGLLLACLVLALPGCKGYPTEDEPPPTAKERVARMNSMLSEHDSDALRLTLVDVCHLSVRWNGRKGPDLYPLQELRVSVDTGAAEQFQVRIQGPQDTGGPFLLLSKLQWDEMTLIRGDFARLRADCVISSQRGK